MEARASTRIYRTMKRPVVIGKLRHKAWSWLIPPTSDVDPVWTKRCQDYWELQQETYGLVFSNFTMVMDWEEQVVITYAVVLDVLPGERRIDYVVPRVADERRRHLGDRGGEMEVEIRQAKDVDPAQRACPSCGAVGGAHRMGCVVIGRSFQ